MKNLIYLAMATFLFLPTSFAQTVHGVFKVVKGDVQVSTKSGTTAKAKIGQKVFPSDKIKAGKDSRAKIVMVDKNELNISPDSEIIIESYQYKPEENKKNVLINVLYGKVRAKVEQKYDEGQNKFQIKTPTAVAGVRGTDFITGFNRVNRTTQVVTFEGRVEFGLPAANGQIANAVMVGVGETSTLNAGAPPQPPAPVPKADLQQMDKASDAATAPAPAAQSQPAPTPQEGKKSEDGGGTKSPAPGPGAANDKPPQEAGPAPKIGDAPRQPSSVAPIATMPGGSMLRPEDMPSSGVVAPPLPSFQAPPTMPNMNVPNVSPALNDIIQTQNRRLNITITNGN